MIHEFSFRSSRCWCWPTVALLGFTGNFYYLRARISTGQNVCWEGGLLWIRTHLSPCGGSNWRRGSRRGISGFGGAEATLSSPFSSAGSAGLLQAGILSDVSRSSNPPVCPTAGCGWTGDNGAEPSCLSAANRTRSWNRTVWRGQDDMNGTKPWDRWGQETGNYIAVQQNRTKEDSQSSKRQEKIGEKRI